MIINVRGTSGAGKTHLVREVLARFPRPPKPHYKSAPIEYPIRGGETRVYERGRRHPLYYTAGGETIGGPPSTAILGHYESPCGGCDTLPDYDFAVHLARQLSGEVEYVLMEGLLLSEEHHRFRELARYVPLKIIYLETPIEECLDAINERRRERDSEAEDVDPENTVNRVRTIERNLVKLEDEGVDVLRLDREDARRWVMRELRLWGMPRREDADEPRAPETMGLWDAVEQSEVEEGWAQVDSSGRRVAILVTGPNASGKTTAIERALDGLDVCRLKRKSADRPEPAEILSVDADQYLGGGTKADVATEKMIGFWEGDWPVLAVEGIDRNARAFADAAEAIGERDVYVFCVTVAPEVLRANIEARCERTGRTFNSDYRDRKRCEYEGGRRYPNLVDRYFKGAEVERIEIGEGYEGSDRLARRIREVTIGEAQGAG